MRKRTKARIRRALCLLAVLAGSACAWCGGAAIVANAVHGWDKIPELTGLLFAAWLMTQAAGWLGDDWRGEAP